MFVALYFEITQIILNRRSVERFAQKNGIKYEVLAENLVSGPYRGTGVRVEESYRNKYPELQRQFDELQQETLRRYWRRSTVGLLALVLIFFGGAALHIWA